MSAPEETGQDVPSRMNYHPSVTDRDTQSGASRLCRLWPNARVLRCSPLRWIPRESQKETVRMPARTGVLFGTLPD